MPLLEHLRMLTVFLARMTSSRDTRYTIPVISFMMVQERSSSVFDCQSQSQPPKHKHTLLLPRSQSQAQPLSFACLEYRDMTHGTLCHCLQTIRLQTGVRTACANACRPAALASDTSPMAAYRSHAVDPEEADVRVVGIESHHALRQLVGGHVLCQWGPEEGGRGNRKFSCERNSRYLEVNGIGGSESREGRPGLTKALDSTLASILNVKHQAWAYPRFTPPPALFW